MVRVVVGEEIGVLVGVLVGVVVIVGVVFCYAKMLLYNTHLLYN